jgi:hypothetical protein
MGVEILEPTEDEPKKTYRIVYYTGRTVPQKFRSVLIDPFLNTLRSGNDFYKVIDQDAYYFYQEKCFDMLLLRPMLIVKIALIWDAERKEDVVLGWALVEHKTVHYVWVKKEVRRTGICRDLLPKEFDMITHFTNKAINIWVKHFPEVKFVPYA